MKRVELHVDYFDFEDPIIEDGEEVGWLEPGWYASFDQDVITRRCETPGQALDAAIKWAADRGFSATPFGTTVVCLRPAK